MVSAHADTREIQDLTLVDPAKQFYWHQGQCCGPVAVFCLSERLGGSVTFVEILKSLPPQPDGRSMDDLERELTRIGIVSEGREIELDTVKHRLESGAYAGAILHVDGQHWVAAVPSRGGVMYFDYSDWHPIYQLKEKGRYSGFSLCVPSSAVDERLQRVYARHGRDVVG